MGVKKYKPTTPGQRGMTGYTFEEITKSTPERALISPLRKKRRAQPVWQDNCSPSGRWSSPPRSGWWISNAINMAFRRGWLRLNMIRTAQPAWRCCFMPMAKSAISLPPWICVSETACCPVLKRKSARGTACRLPISRLVRWCIMSS